MEEEWVPAENDTRGPLDARTGPLDARLLPRLSFPVVGVGASAGGLEAVIDFLKVMRSDSYPAKFQSHMPTELIALFSDLVADLSQHLCSPPTSAKKFDLRSLARIRRSAC